MTKSFNLKTAFLISGSGTTMTAALKAHQQGKLKGINPVIVIADCQAPGLAKAARYGISTAVVSPKTLAVDLLALLGKYQVDLVSQNGWLPLTPKNVVAEYQSRHMIINQHLGPLDPGRGHDFGGTGMYGARVMCARIAYSTMVGGEYWTESTVHAITAKYDEGDLLRTVRMDMPEIPGSIQNPQELETTPGRKKLQDLTSLMQQRLLPIEHSNVIEVLRQYGKRKPPKPFRRLKPLVKPENYRYLIKAKTLARELFP